MVEQASTGGLVYIGTYTKQEPHVQGRAVGVYIARFDSSTGALTKVGEAPGVVNPSYLALAPGRRTLYAVNEVDQLNGNPNGGVSAFAIDPSSGGLTLLNQQPSHGTGPCYVTVDHTGHYVLVANYGSGSVACYPVNPDGSLGEASDVHQHVGSSVNPQRQVGPHAHSINIDTNNTFAAAADLGLDKVLVYRLDRNNGKLVPATPPSVSSAPGAGPRHSEFHPNGRLFFLINEIGSTLTSFDYDSASGALREIDTHSTLPNGYTGRSHCADLHIHPSGKFVYGSNRGHDSIAIFAIDESSGRMTAVGHEPTQGNTPRNFAIDPSGAYLLAANQNSDTIVTFRIDQATGKLTPTGRVAPFPTPVCIKFA